MHPTLSGFHGDKRLFSDGGMPWQGAVAKAGQLHLRSARAHERLRFKSPHHLTGHGEPELSHTKAVDDLRADPGRERLRP